LTVGPGLLPCHRASARRAARKVEIRPDVLLACEPVDLNIVLERLETAPAERFNLIVARNIFVYYDALEPSLENASAMLKPGGLLLTNDRLCEVNGSSMRLAGVTVVRSSLAASVPVKPWVGIGSDSSNIYIPA